MGTGIGSFCSIRHQLHRLPNLHLLSHYRNQLTSVGFKTRASSSSSSKSKNRWTPSQNSRKGRRRLISIETSGGKWKDKWTSDYNVSFEDLQLTDLVDDTQQDSEVFITLTIEKHASFGFTVYGRISTSFSGVCGTCSSLYCRKINTTINVWLLPSRRDKRSTKMPDIGGDDPSVIYVKPGCEADLDSVVRDAIRLAISVQESCSESCERSEQVWECIGQQEVSVDRRWSKLLELRNSIQP